MCQLKLSTWEKPRNLDEIFNVIQDYHLPPTTCILCDVFLQPQKKKKMNYFGHKNYNFAGKVHLMVAITIFCSVCHSAGGKLSESPDQCGPQTLILNSLFICVFRHIGNNARVKFPTCILYTLK